MNRNDAWTLLNEHVKTHSNIQHALESEAVMRALATHFEEDVEKWGLCGLLHDLDWEKCNDDATKHGLITEEILLQTDLDKDVIEAIPPHNFEYNGKPAPSTLMAKALVPAETVTGIIFACVLVRPNKDIGAIPLKSIKKKFKDKAFARNCSRDSIRKCEELGIELGDFLVLARDAIAGIQHELGIE